MSEDPAEDPVEIDLKPLNKKINKRIGESKRELERADGVEHVFELPTPPAMAEENRRRRSAITAKQAREEGMAEAGAEFRRKLEERREADKKYGDFPGATTPPPPISDAAAEAMQRYNDKEGSTKTERHEFVPLPEIPPDTTDHVDKIGSRWQADEMLRLIEHGKARIIPRKEKPLTTATPLKSGEAEYEFVPLPDMSELKQDSSMQRADADWKRREVERAIREGRIEMLPKNDAEPSGPITPAELHLLIAPPPKGSIERFQERLEEEQKKDKEGKGKGSGGPAA